jgi:GT2 family glycosyltransferase
MTARVSIIPTYHRPDDVENALRSLIRQTRRPDEILVIDDGELPTPPLESECRAAGIAYRYARKDKPGLTESRELGVSMADGNLIGFFDDDVILEPDCLRHMVEPFEADARGRLGAVGANITNYPPVRMRDRIRRLLESLFLISGFRQGRAWGSSFCVDFYQPFPERPERAPVDFLPGGAVLYRREVFEHCRFTPGYRAVAFGEDKDFTFQVGEHFQMQVASGARLAHLASPAMRPDKERAGRMFILGRYLNFRRFFDRGLWSRVLFLYSLGGYTLLRLGALLVFPNRGKARLLRGVFSAYRDMLLGRVPRLF